LSVLCGIAIPVGNIILPLVLWLTKKDKIQGLQKVGAKLLNFQIVWTFISFIVPVLFLIYGFQAGFGNGGFLFSLTTGLYMNLLTGIINYLIAIVLAILNRRGKLITYPSMIPMIK
jgi:uncharacterized Tic20 family protein